MSRPTAKKKKVDDDDLPYNAKMGARARGRHSPSFVSAVVLSLDKRSPAECLLLVLRPADYEEMGSRRVGGFVRDKRGQQDTRRGQKQPVAAQGNQRRVISPQPVAAVVIAWTPAEDELLKARHPTKYVINRLRNHREPSPPLSLCVRGRV